MVTERTPEARTGSLHVRLARLGFADAGRAVRMLSEPGLVGLGVEAVEDLALAADPDLALTTLSRMVESTGSAAFVASLDDDVAMRARAYAVLGISAALGDHLVRHPDHWTVLRAGSDADAEAFAHKVRVQRELLESVGADPLSSQPVASASDAGTLSSLRSAYRRRLLSIAAADIADGAAFADVSAALSDLADAT
ncbi:MAG: bifunctional glutamine-synthetase adenylyltransferase/deadenyltransferase, partial [Actinobacteria bacterium]|nr:bifunctional glutamine-synthetase adenylyltransferase/deadenyltransferase [Actinomycetota bacterium]